ncbi:lipopolysaccharide biosynthesis protein [Metabacillus litoralis]|uniref:lipopolysaccharide biosynthesis protein n=1 Tax=Metabacillus litoralis TaxID=152268 RepID=UPI002041B2A9|nr:oligosaccharide flippase family protein [Metabacillus litoralis]MCM3161734.1 oligosaccharide flippase family protein [Metabacillus litoralis]
MFNLRLFEYKKNEKNSNMFNTLQTLLTNGLIILLNLGTGIITARFLGVEGRGNQAAMIMLPQFLAYTMTLGLPSSIIYNFNKQKENARELISTTVFLAVLIGSFSALIGFFFIPTFLRNYDQNIILFAQYAIFLTPLGILSTVATPILKVNNEYRIFNRLRYLMPLLTLLLLIFLVITGFNSPFTFAIAYLAPGIPLTLWLIYKIIIIYGFALKNLKYNTKILMGYGLRAYGIDLVGTFSRNINQLLITSLFSPLFLGLYVIANSISNMLNIFQNSIVEVLFPSTAGKNKETVINVSIRSARLSNYITLVVALFMISITPILIRVLYGEEYLEATNLLRILLIAVLVSSSNWIMCQCFLSLDKPETVAILQAVGIVITIPLFIMFVKYYGVTGSGLAILSSNLIRLLLTICCFKFVLKVNYPNIFFSKNDIRYIKGKIMKKYGVVVYEK